MSNLNVKATHLSLMKIRSVNKNITHKTIGLQKNCIIILFNKSNEF